jgi:membrane-associated phospholipid phosphatase
MDLCFLPADPACRAIQSTHSTGGTTMTPTTSESFVRSSLLSRRAVVGSALAAAAISQLGPMAASAARQEATGGAATWRTWLLASADELRPTAPSEPTDVEVAELLEFQDKRTDETVALVKQWGADPAVIPWVNVGMDLAKEFMLSGPRDSRAQALLRTAIYDAVLAALDAQATYPRDAPAVADSRIAPVEGVGADQPSFPSVHAAVAGANETVLPYVFPDAEAGRFTALSKEAAESRLWAGANYRSDIEAGLTIGRAVGERAVARGTADGSDAKWDGSGRLTGPGYWEPTPPAFVETPVEPLCGTWETWVLASGDAVRPAPYPAYDTPLWRAELEAVQEAVAGRTLEQTRIVDYWVGKGAFRAFTDIAKDLIERDGLDTPHAARVLALMSVAQADAEIAIFDAKYTYWTSRPVTEDPDLDVMIPTPSFPSYPSGYSAVAGSAAAALAHLFPKAEVDLLAAAAEAAAQRCWSGIHYPLDDDVGLEMGYRIGRLVNEVARDDGAE